MKFVILRSQIRQALAYDFSLCGPDSLGMPRRDHRESPGIRVPNWRGCAKTIAMTFWIDHNLVDDRGKSAHPGRDDYIKMR
jgi:hypothetical protein